MSIRFLWTRSSVLLRNKNFTTLKSITKSISTSKIMESSNNKSKIIESWKENVLQRNLEVRELVHFVPCIQMAKTLLRSEANFKTSDVVPPTFEAGYFHSRASEQELAPDGYDAQFSPPPPFEKRVWGGATLNWNISNPLKIGQNALEKTFVKEVKFVEKSDLVIVTLSKEIRNDIDWTLKQDINLVYMPIEKQSKPKEIKKDLKSNFSIEVFPSTIMLFRYSALTFNCHKIHFDSKYTKEVEGYPGLLVHGPLQATWLMEAFIRSNPKAKVNNFTYRAIRPLFDSTKMTVQVQSEVGKQQAHVWIENDQKFVTMEGEISFSNN